MRTIDQKAAATATIHPAWETLDEASQILARTESLVLLLSVARDVEEHHAYGAELACELLRTLKEKLSVAQDQIRPRADRFQAVSPAGSLRAELDSQSGRLKPYGSLTRTTIGLDAECH